MPHCHHITGSQPENEFQWQMKQQQTYRIHSFSLCDANVLCLFKKRRKKNPETNFFDLSSTGVLLMFFLDRSIFIFISIFVFFSFYKWIEKNKIKIKSKYRSRVKRNRIHKFMWIWQTKCRTKGTGYTNSLAVFSGHIQKLLFNFIDSVVFDFFFFQSGKKSEKSDEFSAYSCILMRSRLEAMAMKEKDFFSSRIWSYDVWFGEYLNRSPNANDNYLIETSARIFFVQILIQWLTLFVTFLVSFGLANECICCQTKNINAERRDDTSNT